jgi:hypothetical protein
MARKEGFTPRFEGAETLEGLLALAGANVDARGAVEAMAEAAAEKRSPAEVFPAFFDEEPRFPDPAIAQRLYENLFGLWEAVKAGGRTEALLKGERPARVKPVRPEPPGTWEEGPDEAWVEKAWRYLDADAKVRERLWHSFENRQDALIGWLDGEDLTDDGYGVLRLLLSELSAMIELGTQSPLSAARVEGPPGSDDAGEVPAPEALWAYATEALAEAEQDEEAPLAPGESERVKRLARAGLGALWRARKG